VIQSDVSLYSMSSVNLEYIRPTYWTGCWSNETPDRVWNQKNVSTSTKIRTYSTCVLSVYSSMAQKTGPLLSLTGGDWIHSTHDINDVFSASDGMITSPTMKFYIELASSWPHLSYVKTS